MPSSREPGKPDPQRIGEGMQAYCVKCRTKRRMLDRRLEVSRAGREVMKGNCPVCDTRMCRLLGRLSLQGARIDRGILVGIS